MSFSADIKMVFMEKKISGFAQGNTASLKLRFENFVLISLFSEHF